MMSMSGYAYGRIMTEDLSVRLQMTMLSIGIGTHGYLKMGKMDDSAVVMAAFSGEAVIVNGFDITGNPISKILLPDLSRLLVIPGALEVEVVR